LRSRQVAVTGIFGMASYSVSKLLKEQGIRIALGAQHVQVMRSILDRPVILLFTGSLIGLFLGVFTGSLMSHLVAYAARRARCRREDAAHSGVVQTATAQEESRVAFADHPQSDTIYS
jgi:ABC-type antimicrobial peptide transport system permease subunit